MRSDLVDIEAELKHQTDKAILVSADGEREVWIPKSQCEFDQPRPGGSCIITITLSQSVAEEKGLV